MSKGYSPFMKFALEKKNNDSDWQNLDLPDLVDRASVLWNELTTQEKNKYRRRDAGKSSNVEEEPKDSMGRNLQDVREQLKEEENYPAEMKDRIRMQYKEKDIENAVFTVIHINIFEKIHDQILPAEICVANFSLKRGLIDLYHDFPAPGTIPYGWLGTCLHGAEKTHKIPLDLATSNPNYHEILAIIEEFMDNKEGSDEDKLLFTWTSDRKLVQQTLDFMYTKALKGMNMIVGDEKKKSPYFVAEIKELFNFANPAQVEEALVSRLDSARYIWDGICCDLHNEYERNAIECSQAKVRSWIYNFCSCLCPYLEIPVIPGKHIPNPVRALEYNVYEDSSSETSLNDSSSDTASVISQLSGAANASDLDISDLSDVESIGSSDSLTREVAERMRLINLQRSQNKTQYVGGEVLALTRAASSESLDTGSVISTNSSSGYCRKDVLDRIKRRIQAERAAK